MSNRRRPSGRAPPGRRAPPTSNRTSTPTLQFQISKIAPNISYTPLFNTALPRVPPPSQPTPTDWESYTPTQRTQAQSEAWLSLSKSWEQWPNFSKSWEGVRHLGKGGAGSAELYRKIGSTKESEGMPKHVVVKESQGSDKDLLSESMFLQLFTERNTPHVLKIYRGYHEGEVAPQNVGGMFDVGRENFQKRHKRLASRIYLEFCEKGDVERWATENADIVIEEKVIWSMIECLAQACMMLEYGYEVSEARSGEKWRPMCHLDLKPANILISNKDSDHDDVGIFKMADFGLSAHVPEEPTDPGWLTHVGSQLTLGWGAPEQFFPQMKNRSYSTPANVFGIASIIYYVMTKQQIQIGQGMAYIGFPSNKPHVTIRPPVLTCGRSLLDNPTIINSGTYSKTLIRTLLQCLAYSPHERMTAKQLLKFCTKGRFLFTNVLEEYTYERSQPVTTFWPDRAAAPIGIPGYEHSKELLKYYPTPEAIAAAKEREERFLESFWVTPTKIVEPPNAVFTNPFTSGAGLDSSTSGAFSFGEQTSDSSPVDSNILQSGSFGASSASFGSGFVFRK